MQFKAFIPILSPIIILEDEVKEKQFITGTFDKMIKELQDEKSYPFYIKGKMIEAKLEIKEETKEILQAKHNIKNTFRINYCLSIIIDLDIEEYKEELERHLIKENYTTEEIIEIRISDLVSEFEKSINDFRIAMNIAFPGFFEIQSGYITVDNVKYKETQSSISCLKEAFLEARKRKWPQIDILNIRKTWKWLLDREDFIDAMGNKPIERALSSFTYIFNSENYEDLFYSLIGIEAIYTKGKQGILEQLREKSASVFGEPENYKNTLNKMYDIRSKFIHGSLNFPSKYYIYDGIAQFDKFTLEDYSQCLEMAEALLVATIQQFVIKNKETLKYNLEAKFE